MDSRILTSAYGPPAGGLADFCLANDERGWHLFHIYREYAKPRGCITPTQEVQLGRAFSKDLLSWETRDSALHIREGHWDSAHLWAPSVVKHEGAWYMLYTGMDEKLDQKIGVVRSRDLEEWEYPVDHAVIDVAQYGWGNCRESGWIDCRDPYVFRWNDEWLCYYTTRLTDGEPAMGIAVSNDLLSWEDRGWVLKRPWQNGEGGGTYMTESPCVFTSGDRVFMVYNQGLGIRYVVSDDPFDFKSSEVKTFMDCVFNFEILDRESGLFAYANGGVFSCLRFGYADISGDGMKLKLPG